RALTKGLLEAQLEIHSASEETKRRIAREISDPGHLDQPDAAPVTAVLTGRFDDGRGTERHDPRRIDFVPHAWPEYGVWILSQMQRWGHLPGKVDYREVVGRVMQSASSEAIAAEVGFDRNVARRGLEHLSRTSLDDPFHFMLSQPYCSFRESSPRG